jgi:hypothetical protein
MSSPPESAPNHAGSGTTVSTGSGNDRKNEEKKKGHRCCLYCCDTRRAVIIVNAIRIVMLMSGLITLRAIVKATGLEANETDAEEKNATGDNGGKELYGGDRRVAFVMYLVVATGCAIAGIVGALKYNMIMVAAAVVPMCLETCVALYRLDILFIAILAGFIYPHVMFVKEIHDKVMSEENYPNVRYSCCCV